MPSQRGAKSAHRCSPWSVSSALESPQTPIRLPRNADRSSCHRRSLTTTPISAHPTPAALGARDPHTEAQRLLAGRFDARVLEPSPPAVNDDWFADDPTDPAGAEHPVVGPTSAAALTWDRWLRDFPEQSAWATDRWLGAYRAIPRPPEELPATLHALHRLAVYVLSPARRRANGKIALRWTFGGFGTPFFGADEQARIAGTWLVRQIGTAATAVPITSLNEAAGLVLGTPPDLEWAASFDVPPAGDLDAPLAIDPAASLWLGDWYGFAYSVLEELRADADATDASRVQLWVEHFDAAFECLPEGSGRRAGYGVSPGDAAHPEPYLYVAPWNFDQVPQSELWNATAFGGAVLTLSSLLDAHDQRTMALEWLRERRALLSG